ncbi:MAG: amino acid ABC transporter permease [Acetomicrobium sp.]|uniref:amino acid ABC transporter permease n=1 Tax=Acetomicrobium TaxID=49894 RepID=UPI00169318AC|nr:amino acid ABC transporter permease [Acetomicrobium mobile]MDI9377500.1 amino acid ABC transporter permease [Synergistota bacterium]NLI42359.1 amino acid ABC transporter permease [Synergistaceae bacterium]HOB11191.1 amino acid ABC transporter permease [Acetomicrobium sp.]HQA36957.1 amino acid ABC transporter permease [Acetomicrobium sp.]HQC88061.1 amino acid ABC transporter permease [Acetomicrobium sp.]
MLDFFELVQKSLPTLLEGTFVTIKLTILILALGLVLGLIIAFFQTYGNKPVRLLAGIYDRIFRSVPELVLLLLVFYGLPNIGFRLSPFYAAVLALGLRSAAYMAQIFRGSFMSVGSDQLTAAYSLGMGEYKAFIYVIFPQAIRAFIPPFANEYAIILKDTSLAYAIGVVELLRHGQYIIAVEYKPLPIFLVIAAIYFVLTFGVARLLKMLENKLKIPGIGV